MFKNGWVVDFVLAPFPVLLSLSNRHMTFDAHIHSSMGHWSLSIPCTRFHDSNRAGCQRQEGAQITWSPSLLCTYKDTDISRGERIANWPFLTTSKDEGLATQQSTCSQNGLNICSK